MADEKENCARPEDVEDEHEEQEEEDWGMGYVAGMCEKKDYEARTCCPACCLTAADRMHAVSLLCTLAVLGVR